MEERTKEEASTATGSESLAGLGLDDSVDAHESRPTKSGGPQSQGAALASLGSQSPSRAIAAAANSILYTKYLPQEPHCIIMAASLPCDQQYRTVICGPRTSPSPPPLPSASHTPEHNGRRCIPAFASPSYSNPSSGSPPCSTRPQKHRKVDARFSLISSETPALPHAMNSWVLKLEKLLQVQDTPRTSIRCFGSRAWHAR